MKGKKEKKDYDQNIGLHEAFLESVPTALIIAVIGIKSGIFDCKKYIQLVFVTHPPPLPPPILRHGVENFQLALKNIKKQSKLQNYGFRVHP